MNLNLCPDAVPSLLLFDLSIAPPLLFYAYIPMFILCVFFGIFIFLKDDRSILSQYFLIINLFFAAYVVLSLFQWTAAYMEIVHLAWQLYLFSEIGIFIFSVIFAFVFLNKKDIKTMYKSIVILFFAIIAVVVPSRLNVDLFDLQNCEGIPGDIWSIIYVPELVCLLLILLVAVTRSYENEDKKEKLKNFIFAISLFFFLGIFWASNYFGELTRIYEINLVGPLGMVLFLGMVSYMMVKYKVFNTKLLAPQILIVALTFLIAALLFIHNISYIRIVVLFTLGLVSILGSSLIRSVKREISQRERIEKLAVDLEAANAQLRELDRQKDELLGIVSHQLATPISALKWDFEMLLDGDIGKVKEEQKDFFQKLQGVTAHLSDLVSMILDVSRIQLGRMKVDRTELDLSVFFGDVLSIMEAKAKERKVDLSSTIQDKVGTGCFDKRLMLMITENLLSNAIKYTPEGGKVKLSVKAQNGMLKFSVSDTGCGIPKQDQDKIFGKLYRASNVRNVDGNGFGLYVVKGAAEAQGGTIKFESIEGKGTTFFVELPLTAKEQA